MTDWFAADRRMPATLPQIWHSCGIADVNKIQRNCLTKACVSYVTRTQDFSKAFKPVRASGLKMSQTRALRLALLNDYRTNLGLKLWLLRNTARLINRKPLRLIEELPDAGLLPNDVVIFDNLQVMGLADAIKHKLYTLPDAKIPSTRRVERECAELIQEIYPFMGKFVNRKMHFILSSQNMKMSDLRGDLIEKAIQTFYFLTPYVTPEHRRNIVKRAVHNHGINMIKYWSHPEISRLRQDDEGRWYNLIETDYKAAPDLELENREHTMTHYNTMVSAFRDVENRMDLQRCIDNHGRVARRMLPLLLLKDDNEFINYVNSRSMMRFDNCADILENLGSVRYRRYVRKHCQVSKQEARQVYASIKNMLHN